VRIGRPALVAGAAAIGVAVAAAAVLLAWPRDDPARTAAGRAVYDRHCASCHGAQLEGEPNWREKKPTGRMPAPPHDATGHTWHHADAVLVGITKFGLVPGKYAPPGYESDMPGFGGALSDEEILAVVAYIKSTWPDEIRRAQSEANERARRAR
jgi:S-disulfanyl-L-cysteine oxidoreductase SoxD